MNNDSKMCADRVTDLERTVNCLRGVCNSLTTKVINATDVVYVDMAM